MDVRAAEARQARRLDEGRYDLAARDLRDQMLLGADRDALEGWCDRWTLRRLVEHLGQGARASSLLAGIAGRLPAKLGRQLQMIANCLSVLHPDPEVLDDGGCETPVLAAGYRQRNRMQAAHVVFSWRDALDLLLLVDHHPEPLSTCDGRTVAHLARLALNAHEMSSHVAEFAQPLDHLGRRERLLAVAESLRDFDVTVRSWWPNGDEWRLV